jgi:RNA polymerase sigma factor (sigma-70 family)
MATVESGVVPQAMRGTLTAPGETGPSDDELLSSFIALHDETAFEALVHRYGGMVMGVCRRILRDESDAEDAFQATFLVLVRKASSIKPRSLAGNWLYGVATKTALKARALRSKRFAKEREVATRTERSPVTNDAVDLEEVLDQELQQLPNNYRAAVLLCDLEGKSITEAARQLGCPPGTVGTRLTRGRRMLARRLTKHGLVLSGAAMAALIGQTAVSASAVPPVLVTSTTTAAMLYSAGVATSGVLSGKAVVLAQSVIKSMLLGRLGIASSVIVAIAVVGTTVAPSSKWKAHASLPGHQFGARSVAFSPDDSRLVSGAHDGLVRVWDVDSGQCLFTLDSQKIHQVRAATFGDGGGTIAAGFNDGNVVLWSLQAPTDPDYATDEFGHEVRAITFCADRPSLAWARDNGAVERERHRGGLALPPVGPDGVVDCVAFSPDGQTIAWGMRDGSVRVWDVSTRREQGRFQIHAHQVWSVTFSRDGKFLVSADHFGHIQVWNAYSGEVRLTMRDPVPPIFALALSSDRRYVASAAYDSAIRIWDGESGELLTTLTDHKAHVRGLAFSSQGHLLASASEDGTVKLWAPASAAE